MASTYDLFIIALTVLLPLTWYFRESIPFIGGKPTAPIGSAAGASSNKKVEEGDPRDFVGKMERGVSLTEHGVQSARGLFVTEQAMCDVLRFADGHGGGVRN